MKVLRALVLVPILLTLHVPKLISAEMDEKLDWPIHPRMEDREKLTGPATMAMISAFETLLQAIQNINGELERLNKKSGDKRISRKAIKDCELIPTDSSTNKNANYYFCDKELNWYMADQHCRLHGTHLAVVDNEAIFTLLVRYLTKFGERKGYTNYGALLGGADLGNEGNWYWVPNGKLLSWGKWLPGQPDNWKTGENCLSLRKLPEVPNVGFNDDSCTYIAPNANGNVTRRTLLFICESP